MVISVDAKKPFDEVENLFMIKAIQKVGLQGTCLNIIKAIYNPQLISYSIVITVF